MRLPQRLIRTRKLIEPLIIVAVANIGEERVHEYAPTPAVIEAKDHQEKTQPRPGASFTDIFDRRTQTVHRQKISDQAGRGIYWTRWILARGSWPRWRLEFFTQTYSRRLIVMSPSIWWDDFAIFRLGGIQLGEKPPLKIWLDTGTAEPGWEQTRELCK